MIVTEGHPALSQVCRAVDFARDNAVELAEALAREMLAANGLGLAAPQIGVGLRVFVLKSQWGPMACFNPSIQVRMNGEEKGSEGCLSFPGIVLQVRRARSLRVRFQGMGGEWADAQLDGLAARAFQHELDHLDGVTLADRVPAATLEAARPRAAA